jgi:DNA helicase-2/ATP-dependent DNA helicase PcrA
MRHRIQKTARQFVLTCTFHSLCAKILRESIEALGYRRDFTIYDADDSERLLKQCMGAFNLKDEKGLLKTFKAAISGAKNNLVTPATLAKDDPQLASVYELYQAKLKEYQAVDFDDLLFLTVKLFQEHPHVLSVYQNAWSFILIDEYQDTNIAQYLIIKLLAEKHHNIFAVGDPDQSIYSWRGASIRNILEFDKDFPGAKVIPLEQNYRSKTTILNAANALIKHNPTQYEKQLWSALGAGDKICLYICEDEHAEARFVTKNILKHHRSSHTPLKECAIFYRTNFQSRVFEDALLLQKIPYVIIGGLSFYQRREVKDILAILRMVASGADFLSFSRTINLPKRGFGEVALSNLKEIAAAHHLPIIEACTQILDRKIPCKLSLKQYEGLKSYITMVLALREMIKAQVPLQTLLSEAIERSSYLTHLRDDPETFDERRGNLAELVHKAAEWEQEHSLPSLTTFLEELSLRSAMDEKNVDQDAIRLMTLHHAKGLEFSVVFLVGMEEDLFPHINSKDSDEAIQEERRLCYVGMTRAKENLYISAAKERFLWGTSRSMYPSRFLREIPQEYVLKQS